MVFVLVVNIIINNSEMETNSPEVKTSHFFVITGGIYPGKNRSTSVEVLSPDLDNCYKTVDKWCRINFPDFNHYHDMPGLKTALYQIPGSISIPHYPVRISRNYEEE
jgi:hypothetical protein